MEQLGYYILMALDIRKAISWILAAVIVIFLFGLVMVLVRRDARRRNERASAGIMRAAGLNTHQSFEINSEELDLDELCGQPGVRAIMNDAERAILKAYAGGETESELAGRLLISRSEMETMVSELFARLEVNNRAELLKKLQQMLREEEMNVSE